METASESKNTDIANDLLKYFIENDAKDSFAACLYVCYDLLLPDQIMELAWRNKLMDYAMPYLIQVASHSFSKLKMLEQQEEMRQGKDSVKEKQEAVDLVGGMGAPLMLTYGGNQMVHGAPGMTPQMQQGQMGMGTSQMGQFQQGGYNNGF
jgi:clathrin heavy chain